MSFQRYKKSDSQVREPTLDPAASIRVGGDLYLNGPAIERWLPDAERVAIYVDGETNRLAFEAADSDDPEAYKLQTQKGAGAAVTVKGPLDAIGIDTDVIESATDLPPPEQKDGRVVIDVDPLDESAADETGGDDTPADEPDPDSPADPIYVAAHWRSGNGTTFHESPDCPRLAQSNVVEKDRSVLFDDANPCSFCAEDENEDDEGYDGAVVLEQLLDDEDPKHLAADLDGCSTFHQVARELNVNRGAAVALAAELGLGEELRSGKNELAATDIRSRIEEVTDE